MPARSGSANHPIPSSVVPFHCEAASGSSMEPVSQLELRWSERKEEFIISCSCDIRANISSHHCQVPLRTTHGPPGVSLCNAAILITGLSLCQRGNISTPGFFLDLCLRAWLYLSMSLSSSLCDSASMLLSPFVSLSFHTYSLTQSRKLPVWNVDVWKGSQRARLEALTVSSTLKSGKNYPCSCSLFLWRQLLYCRASFNNGHLR